MAAIDLPGRHNYQNAGSSDGEVTSDKEKLPVSKKRRHDSRRSSSDHSSRDSEDSERRRRRKRAEEVERRRRRREERHRHVSSDSEEENERSNKRGSTRQDHRRSRSQSRERNDRDGAYRRRDDYEVHPRYWDSRSPDRERGDRRKRESDRDHSRANKDLYWNKYNRYERRSDDKSKRRSNERESENRDPNSLKARPEDSKDTDAGDGRQPAPNSKKTADGGDGVEALTMRTGGAYIPPARLRMMQAALTDKQSAAYQRFAWEALKKSINGLINKINVSNISIIVRELFKENIIRGRGVLARSIMQAQAASPTFTHVYAALVAIINSKFPQIGELLLTRLIILFRRGFRRNNKDICFSATRFIAHLVNQLVADDVIALEILTLLLQNATNDSVEVAVGFLKEVGAKLSEVSPKGLRGTFERLGSILNEGQIDKRVQYMVEVMFAIRKDGFKDHPSVIQELDLVQEEEQFTHLISLEKNINGEDILNVFKHDPEYEATEEKYKTIRKEILDESSSDDDSAASGSESSSEEEEDEDENADQAIVDNTETNLISLRRTIYLTIQSSLEFEECAHKLLKMELKPGQEVELCHMILDCCAQQRTYEKFFGLLAQRFCRLNKAYVDPFESIFRDSYETIHRLETNKLRNVAKLFAHLLHTDAINWTVLRYIKLNEDDTTSSSRIFIKILFQELSEYMGLPKLNERVKDPTLQEAFAGLFPRDNPCNTRFAINFFTSIGLGGLTDELREHLKSQPKVPLIPPPVISNSTSSSSEEEDSSSDSEDTNSSNDSSSSDSSTDTDEKYKRKKKREQYDRKRKSQKVDSPKRKSQKIDSPKRSTKNRSSEKTWLKKRQKEA